MYLPEHLRNSNQPKYAKIRLDYQNVIPDLPIPPQELYRQACSNDNITIDSWKEKWIANTKANKAFLGSFKDKSIAKLYKSQEYKPCIIAGSGPSLAENVHILKDRGGIPLVSCLHNFHLMEDNDARPDYYVSLDAGDVVLEEISEGGKRTPDEYWELTKDRKLIAFIGSPPELLKRWKGEVYVFNAPVPNPDYQAKIDEIEKFHCWMSTGGNVLGAALYFARGTLGCGTIAFVGADFCFSYDNKFHAWDSKYDKNLGMVVKLVDVYGNKRLSWQSYVNFNGWFEQLSVDTPQIFINCSEGGCLGAFPQGNVASIRQMKLSRFLFMHRMHEELNDQMVRPEEAPPVILF